MKKYDVLVIGGGPGGYVAAIRTAQYGKHVALIEMENVGGTCLNLGCIPTKALLKSAEVYHTVKNAAEFGIIASDVTFDYEKIIARKDSVVSKLRKGVRSLLKNAGVEVVFGKAVLTNSNTVSVNNELLSAEYIILATGSAPAIPNITGINTKGIMSSDMLLGIQTCPDSIVIIGGGVIGVEFACLYSKLGVNVTVIEMTDTILAGIDEEISSLIGQTLMQSGVLIITGAKVSKFSEREGVCVEYEKDGVKFTASAQVCLIAAGRKPSTANIGLELAGVQTDNGFVRVDEYLRTSIPNIYAIGDITGKYQLAHAASAQALVASSNIAGFSRKMMYNIIPTCVYTTPEIASVGLTEKQAASTGYSIKTGRFPVSANGKSIIIGETTGFAKLITDVKTGEILGAHMLAPGATDMISEICSVMRAEGTIDELSDTIHPHPSVSEIIMEAAHDVHELSCHFLKP